MEGISTHAYQVLKRITVAHPEHQFLFLFDRPHHDDFIFSSNVTPVTLFPQARHPLLYYCWFEYSVTSILNQSKADLFYSPDGFLSLRTKVPSIPVMHDLNFEHYPNDLPSLTSWYYRRYFPKYAVHAAKIITVSEFSKQDIEKTYNIPSGKIDVVYNGADEIYRKLSGEECKNVKAQYSGGSDYFLYVSALHPRKNVTRLLLAFDKVKEDFQTDMKLLLVGPHYFRNVEMEQTYNAMKYKDSVIFTGRMEKEELSKVTGAAFALVYISYFEGFGIPIAEAFNCGVPVIASGVTSMPEVAGDAALFIDPFSYESIAGAMLTVLKKPEVRKDLIEKGEKRKNLFTWDRTAQLTWVTFEKILNP
jgi:glycosyltransferase involved in cell wall biosynthesis